MVVFAGRTLTWARSRVYYGWWMVASGFTLMFVTTGVGFYGFAAFLDPIVKEFGWSRAVTSGAFSLRSAESGLLSPLMGYLADRLGPRVILIVGFIIEGLGFILLAQVHSLWQFYAAFAILALGLAGGSFLIVSTAINNWFVRQRGKALSLMFLGPAFSGVLVAAIVWLIETIGWRSTLVVAGVLLWVLCIPASLLMRKRPEEYGLLPDGDRPGEEPKRGNGRWRSSAPVRDVQFKVGAVLRTRSYWQYVAALSLQGAGFGALVLFQVSALKTFGLTLAETALVVTIWTFASIPGRLAAGFLADLLDKRLVFASSIAIQIVGAVLFLTTTNLWMGIAYGIVYGIGWGSTTPARLALQGEYWGRAIFGRLMGLQQAVAAALGVAAPVFVGRWFDLNQDYHGAFIVLFAPLFLCLLLVVTMNRPDPVKETVGAAPA